jgi:hypothetical protein
MTGEQQRQQQHPAAAHHPPLSHTLAPSPISLPYDRIRPSLPNFLLPSASLSCLPSFLYAAPSAPDTLLLDIDAVVAAAVEEGRRYRQSAERSRRKRGDKRKSLRPFETREFPTGLQPTFFFFPFLGLRRSIP